MDLDYTSSFGELISQNESIINAISDMSKQNEILVDDLSVIKGYQSNTVILGVLFVALFGVIIGVLFAHFFKGR